MKTKLLFVISLILFSFHAKNSNAQGWQTVGTGINNQVFSLKVFNGELYAGGGFTQAGGNPASRVAVWDGSTWNSLGSGINSIVFPMESYNNQLYAGGIFTLAGGISAKNIARWNGTAWDSVGSGTSAIGGPDVLALKTYNGEIYVGGSFTIAGGVPNVGGIARWNGVSWNSLITATDTPAGITYSFEVYNGSLYVGANGTERWNGTNWDTLGSGVSGGFSGTQVRAMAVYNNELYVGGTFFLAGGLPVNLIAKWNGSSWSDVGGGMNLGTAAPIAQSTVWALKVYNGELYAGGRFDTAGGVPAKNIAKWNGTSWAPVCSGTNDRVRALEVYNGELYVGGSFTIAGGLSASRVARWSVPVAAITPTTASICNNNSVTLTANSGNYNYQWYNNNAPMPGETGNQLSVTTPGNYSVVTSVNGQPCAGTATSIPAVVTIGTGPTNLTVTSSSSVGCAANTIYTGYGAQSITLTANATGAVSWLWSTGATTQSISVTTAGAYSVTAYDAGGCASLQTPETETIINVVDVRCGNNREKVLLCHVPHGNSANAQTICIAPTAVAAHLALHAGDCIGTCTSSQREITSAEEENEIVIEPNPVRNELRIHHAELRIEKAEIFDVLGKRVYHSASGIPHSALTVDVSSFPQGIYFITVTDENKNSVTRKIVKL